MNAQLNDSDPTSATRRPRGQNQASASYDIGGTPFTGGRATIIGTVLGALTIQLVRYTLLANGVPDAAALVVKAAIIAAAVWLQQQNRAN